MDFDNVGKYGVLVIKMHFGWEVSKVTYINRQGHTQRYMYIHDISICRDTFRNMFLTL